MWTWACGVENIKLECLSSQIIYFNQQAMSIIDSTSSSVRSKSPEQRLIHQQNIFCTTPAEYYEFLV